MHLIIWQTNSERLYLLHEEILRKENSLIIPKFMDSFKEPWTGRYISDSARRMITEKSFF